MRIAITGASGLVGRALAAYLQSAGHEVLRLVRRASLAAGEIPWAPERGEIDAAALDGADAAVNLSGENLAAGRWTATRKARLRASRIESTRLLSETLAGLGRKPALLVSASAVGIYGDQGGEWLDEASPAGSDFLARLCVDWEAATEPAARAGIRVVRLRSGVVLSKDGGALARMLLPFRLGLGGVLGPGTQFMSWIAVDDLVAAIGHVLATPQLAGAVNAVAPGPVTNRELTKALGRVLRRPTFAAVPALALRLALGELAEALLGGQRVRPRRLLESGYRFRFPELQDAIGHVLSA